jgi:hypothetical protein
MLLMGFTLDDHEEAQRCIISEKLGASDRAFFFFFSSSSSSFKDKDKDKEDEDEEAEEEQTETDDDTKEEDMVCLERRAGTIARNSLCTSSNFS